MPERGVPILEPATDPKPTEATELPVDAWWSPRVNATIVKVCLVFSPWFRWPPFFSDFAEIQLLERQLAGGTVTFAEPQVATTDRQPSGGACFLLGFLLVILSFIWWLHQVSENLQALQVTQRFGPGKANCILVLPHFLFVRSPIWLW